MEKPGCLIYHASDVNVISSGNPTTVFYTDIIVGDTTILSEKENADFPEDE